MSLVAVLGAAFAAGLAGSGHCLAMCGGIAAALARPAGGSAWTAALLSGSGRVLSYALAGALAALATQALGIVADLQQLRPVVVWASGLALVLIGLRLALQWRTPRFDRLAGRAWHLLQPLTRRVGAVPRAVRPFAAGMIWGWLPCGMAYAMLVLAATRAQPVEGALVMAAFGLGTLPALVIAAGLVGARSGRTLQPRWRIATGVAIAVLAVASIASALQPAHDHPQATHATAHDHAH